MLELKLKALILDTIHNIDVVTQLVTSKVKSVDDWLWQKQLRCYLVKGLFSIKVHAHLIMHWCRCVCLEDGGWRVFLHIRVPGQYAQVSAHSTHWQMLSHSHTSHALGARGKSIWTCRHWEDRISEGIGRIVRQTSACLQLWRSELWSSQLNCNVTVLYRALMWSQWVVFSLVLSSVVLGAVLMSSID